MDKIDEVADVEGTISLPGQIWNTASWIDGDQEGDYIGALFDLHFGNGVLCAEQVQLSKRRSYENSTIKLTRNKYFLPVMHRVSETYLERVWSVYDDWYVRLATGRYRPCGNLAGANDDGWAHKLQLKCANIGVLVSDDLMREIFLPLEKRCLEIYREVAEFGKGPV